MKTLYFYILFISFLVSTLKDQLEDLKKVSQNSQLANEKLAQLQKQVSILNVFFLIINKFDCIFSEKPIFLLSIFK